MFYPNNITTLHLEPTTLCNARCPQCPRNILGSKHSPYGLKTHHLDISLLSQIDVDTIKKVLVNGNYGDIISHSNPLEFVNYIVKRWGSNISLHSNGGGLHSSIWSEFGRHKIHVEFAIDGITNQEHILYRQSTNLSTVFRNAQAFINAGGSATWVMTVFKHNQNSIDAAREMAKEMGFIGFRYRPSYRFNHAVPSGQKLTPVLDDEFNTTHWLQPINDKELPDNLNSIEKKIKLEFKKQHATGKLSARKTTCSIEKDNVFCEVKNNQSIYLSADGRIMPCCYLGKQHIWEKSCNLLGIDYSFNSLTLNTLSEILKHEFWKVLNKTFLTSNVLNTCSYTCGTSDNTKQEILTDTVETDYTAFHKF